MHTNVLWFFFQAEDGIRDLVRSRGLGDVYKRQFPYRTQDLFGRADRAAPFEGGSYVTLRLRSSMYHLSLIHI